MASVVPEMPEMPEMSTSGSSETHANGRERVEGLEARLDPEAEKEMDILKDLPSYNSSNFSVLLSAGNTSSPSSASAKSSLGHTKTYVRLKRKSEEEQPFQEIVTDSKSFILKELEALVAQKTEGKRKSLKRSSAYRSDRSSSSSSCKFPRTDMTDDDDLSSLDSWLS